MNFEGLLLFIGSTVLCAYMNTYFARALMRRHSYAAWVGLGVSLGGVGIGCMMIGRYLP